jgi:PAS domain S-box-containing protein
MSLHDTEQINARLSSVADPIGFLVNLFTHAPVGFAVWNAAGYTVLTNKAFMDIFGVEPPPEYNVLQDKLLVANGMMPIFERAFRGETIQVPTMWYDPREHTELGVTEGRRVAISATIFPLFNQSGELEYVACAYKDQTEIMLANERLHLSEERQRLAEQIARVGAFEWNVQTGFAVWTPELEAMHGLERGGFGGTKESWEQLVHPEDRAGAVARVDEALETFAPVEGEWRVVWKDGSVHWLVSRFQVLKDDAGKPYRLIGVNVDITERKKEEAARLRAEAVENERNALEASLQFSEQFIGILGHDLRNPLNAVKMAARLLKEPAATPAVRDKAVERIASSTERMSRMIDQILDFALSRLGGGIPVERSSTDICDIINTVVDELRLAHPSHVIEWSARTGTGIAGQWDRERLTQVVSNLVANAIQHGDPARPVRVDLKVANESVELSVHNFGAPIPDDLLARVFEPYRRGGKHGAAGGLGLGLFIAHQIVRAHGGKIDVRSTAEEGTCFTVSLPLQATRAG